MVYDGFNRLIKTYDSSAGGSGGGSMTEATEYSCRPDGLRHSKTTGSAVTVHIWDGQDIVYDRMDGSHGPAGDGIYGAKYIRGLGLVARQGDDGFGREEGLEYYMLNAYGDVAQLADAAGTVTKVYAYDAFGMDTDFDPEDTNVFRCYGEYFDNESGSYYLRARYYTPRLGRYS